MDGTYYITSSIMVVEKIQELGNITNFFYFEWIPCGMQTRAQSFSNSPDIVGRHASYICTLSGCRGAFEAAKNLYSFLYSEHTSFCTCLLLQNKASFSTGKQSLQYVACRVFSVLLLVGYFWG